MDQSVKLQTIHNKWKNNLSTCVWHIIEESVWARREDGRARAGWPGISEEAEPGGDNAYPNLSLGHESQELFNEGPWTAAAYVRERCLDSN